MISRTMLRASAALAASVGAFAWLTPLAGAQEPAAEPRCRGDQGSVLLTVETVPAFQGVRFTLAGRTFVSDRKGVAQLAVRCGTHRLSVRGPRRPEPGVRMTFLRWGDDAFQRTRTVELASSVKLQVGFAVDYLVKASFVDLVGRPVESGRISQILLSNSLGSKKTFLPGRAWWLSGSRIIRRPNRLEPTQILYSVWRVVIDGANVVYHAQHRFYPVKTRRVRIQLLLYSARISARDRFFGFPIGSGIVLRYPDSHRERYRFDSHATLLLDSLPRALYEVQVTAPGLSSAVPISLTKNQVVEIRVLSYLDLVVFFGLLGLAALVLLLARRPTLRTRLRPRIFGRRRAAASGGVGLLLGLAALLLLPSAARAESAPTARDPVPVLAYYYIWFDHSSWDRAKVDYPLLGRYSSDDPKVMRRHIESAKQAGIDGFIVSWKSTPVLNRRLAQLIRLANAENFKLMIIYQGLDFYREPLPAQGVADDLAYFARAYAGNPAFDLFGKPVVIWSGTWRFSRAEITRATRGLRQRLLVLASEKSVSDFERVADLVDGDAYYWSSVNPSTFPGYPEKLAAMGDAVHGHGGLWIAPTAPGFDARLIGGTSVVQRDDGETLRREFDAATSSSPDAVGLISWNEFSENSHVEPSVIHGTRYLRVLGDILSSNLTIEGDFDSSEPAASQVGYTLPLLIGLGAVLTTGIGAIFWRRQVRKVAGYSS